MNTFASRVCPGAQRVLLARKADEVRRAYFRITLRVLRARSSSPLEDNSLKKNHREA